MQFFALAALLGLAHANRDDDMEFSRWQMKHGKQYATVEEYNFRKTIFLKTSAYIEDFNSKNSDHKGGLRLGHNQMSDLTLHEYRQRLGYRHRREENNEAVARRLHESPVVQAPQSLDWRDQGVVTPIKDQGQCGDCYIFAGVANIESMWAIAGNSLVSFSEQQLLNCMVVQDKYGTYVKPDCTTGGMFSAVYDFAMQFELELQQTNPYTSTAYYSEVEICDQSLPTYSSLLTNWNQITQNDSTALMNAVANGPVAVAIDASDWAFQFYTVGVYNQCPTYITDSDINHGVLIVGYGSTYDGVDYWIVKNSFGTSWGYDGYGLIERDMTSEQGVCGININPQQPEASFA